MSLLPQELIDTIIDVLEDDIQSLRACTLVSSAFVGRAQQHLFRQVTLTAGQTARTSRLGSLLSESPHLSRAISSLRIVHKRRRRSKSYYLSPLILDRSLIDALPCIREFSLASADWVCWTSFSDVTKSGFHSLFTSGTMSRLTLDSITDVPLRLFECMPALQELHLRNTTFDASPTALDDFELPIQPPKAKLTQLCISGHGFGPLVPFTDWILSSNSCLDLSELQNFSLLIPYDYGPMLIDQVHVINKIVEMCSQSLKELNIIPSLSDLDNMSQVSKIPLVFPDLPALRILHLFLEISDYELPECNPNFIWFSALIGTIQTCRVRRLHTLEIRCNVIQGNPVIAFEPAYWENIHAMITNLSLRSLQNTNITLRPIYEECDDRYTELGRLIKVEMGALNERGILHVDSRPVTHHPDTY